MNDLRKNFQTGDLAARDDSYGTVSAPDAVTGGGNDYYDQRFQEVVSPPQSQTGQGPYDDGPPTISDIIGGGVQNIKNYLTDPSRRTGILSGLIGSALFGPFAGIAAGMAGQRFAARNNNLLTGMNTIDNVNTPPFVLPETKPFFIDQDIRPQYADASKNQLKDYLNILNPDFKLDEILDEEEKKQKRQQELLNEILIG